MKSLYTTIFLYPHMKLLGSLPLPPNAKQELRGFTYGIGSNLPVLPQPTIATAEETNLNNACVLPDISGFHATSFEWSIPTLAKGVYQQHPGPESGCDYKVTAQDVAEFAAKSYVAFYCGGDKPFAEMVPASKAITFDGEAYRQVVSDMRCTPLEIRRLEKLWASIDWCHGALPNIGGVIPVRFTLHGESSEVRSMKHGLSCKCGRKP